MKDKKRIAIIIPSRANALICHDAFLCVLDLTAPLLCPDACGDGGAGSHRWEIRVYSAVTD